MKRSNNTDPLKARLAAHLALGGSIAAFSRDNPGKSERTYQNWAKDPEVLAQIRRQLSEMDESIRRRWTRGTMKAAGVLIKLLDSKNEATQLGAARVLADRHLQTKDSADFEQRLGTVEEHKRNAKT